MQGHPTDLPHLLHTAQIKTLSAALLPCQGLPRPFRDVGSPLTPLGAAHAHVRERIGQPIVQGAFEHRVADLLCQLHELG